MIFSFWRNSHLRTKAGSGCPVGMQYSPPSIPQASPGRLGQSRNQTPAGLVSFFFCKNVNSDSEVRVLTMRPLIKWDQNTLGWSQKKRLPSVLPITDNSTTPEKQMRLTPDRVLQGHLSLQLSGFMRPSLSLPIKHSILIKMNQVTFNDL